MFNDERIDETIDALKVYNQLEPTIEEIRLTNYLMNYVVQTIDEVKEKEAADAEAFNQATKHGNALNRKGKVKGAGHNVVSGMPWRLHDDPMEIDEDL